MNNLLKNIIALIFLGVMFFSFQSQIKQGYNILLEKLFPCSFTIKYSLGTIDERFGLSESDFLEATKKAENIWEDAIGKDLFTYTTDGDLKINLKYDTRQDSTNKMSDIDTQMNDKKLSYNDLKFEYDNLKNDIDTSKNNIKTQSDVNILNKKISRLNILATEINQSVKEINSKVNQYNNIGDSLGGEFEEGLYFSNKDGRGIDIYQFKNNDNLVRLLTHELGHALSLEHSKDPSAIMYHLNNTDSLEPSIDDIGMLKNHCKIK